MLLNLWIYKQILHKNLLQTIIVVDFTGFNGQIAINCI